MMKKIDRKLILAVLFVSIVTLGLVWLIFFVQIPKIRETAEVVQKEKLDSFIRQEKGDKIFKLKKELAGIEDQREKMEAVFLEKNEAVPFFRALEKAASDTSCQIKVEAADLNKVKLDQLKPKPGNAAADEEEGVKKKPNSENKDQSGESAKADEISKLKVHPAFNLEVTGSFSSIMNFLEGMENLPYFVRVLTLDLSAGKVSSQTGSSGTGALSAGTQTAGGGSQAQDKTVKFSLLVIIYSRGTK